ncbi:MAG TPA: AcrB/AcrD/AcrF family protein, partial [Gammaproteobacteria bacterium]|nr:AcrB/AcrD/AcrF family protein [Gammaproteobacteria bacterium]
DGRRVVTVSGEVDTAIATPTEVTNQIEANLLPELTLRFPGVQVGQSGFGREQSEDLGSLADTAMVALLVIYALLASQLKSYAQPLVILTAIPFGAAGALVGHFLLGFNLSFISIFGIVALSGVVVNDALVLVDRYNFLRKTSEMSAIEAVVSASRRRFRAILLTTATTALGLTPMLFESSLQAQFLVPFAVSLATGIVFASAIILFLVPALVIVQEDIKHLPSRLRRGLDTKRPQTIGAD